jgi:tRNA A-37 threonylcarbamoyl transferase component Bud32
MGEAHCLDDQDLLPLTTGETVREEIQAHLDTCAGCRQRFQRLQAEVANLRQAGRGFLTPSCDGSAPATTPEVTPRPVEGMAPSTVLPRQSPVTPTNPAGLSSPRPLATIGKYVVVSPLDTGGQADVYRVLHPTLTKELVLKLSRGKLAGGQADHDHLVAEGRLLADLEHPNLARIYDLDFFEDRPFLVMEYIRGRNLQQHAKQQRLAPRPAAVLVAKLARALGVAHRRGIIHRDLKPGNILIDEAGEPRIIDFGLARLSHAWADDVGQGGGITGTPAYMAPEQARGQNDRIDQRSDVFALGSVLYFLLTGKAPFAGKNASEALDRAARCDFDKAALRAAGVPRRLEAICLRALAADPAERYAKADDLAADIGRLVRRPRKLLLFAVAALLVVLAAAAVPLLAWVRDRFSPPAKPAQPPQYVVTQVQRRVQGQESVYPDLLSAVPLQSGDTLRIRCDVPHGYYPAVFWFDTEGKPTDLTPVAVSAAEPLDHLVYPDKGVVRLKGPSGTEFVLVCASRSEPVRRGEVLKLLEKERPLPALPRHAVLLLDRDKLTVKVPDDRGVGKPEADALAEVQDRLEQLRFKLGDRFDFVAGVAFAHRNVE